MGQEPAEPLRDPPVALAEQLHGCRDDHHADERGVEQYGDSEPETEQLDLPDVFEHERGEDDDHDRGGGDHPGRGGQAVGDGGGGVTGSQVLLPDAGEHEDLVVHGEAEHDGEEHHRYEGVDGSAFDPEQLAGPAPLEDGDDDAVRRADRQHVHEDGLERHEQRPEDGHQQHEPSADDWQLTVEACRTGRTMIGASDAGAHLDFTAYFDYPVYVIEQAVRRYGVVALEEAVQMLTSIPADLYGLRDRGRLVEGAHADVVVFDPDTIAPGTIGMQFDLPAGAGRLYAEPTGVAHVLLNGRPIVEGTTFTDERPGTVFRAGRDTVTPAL